jgi:hypothetical protein
MKEIIAVVKLVVALEDEMKENQDGFYLTQVDMNVQSTLE